jgi:hypothetical protein
MMTKFSNYKKAIAYSVLAVLTVFLVWGAYFYFQISRGRLVYIQESGKWVSRAEYRDLFADYDTPAKNTPEEVYTAFRQALLDGDKEKALEFIKEERREDYEEAFSQNNFLEWVELLPKSISLESISGNYAFYDVNYGTENKNTATFIKNQEGYWEIDSI